MQYLQRQNFADIQLAVGVDAGGAQTNSLGAQLTR
jgi:hypothetical protein